MSRCSESSIWKDTGSPVKHYHKGFYYFTSQLSTNQNNTEQASFLKRTNSEHYIRPAQYLFLTLSLSTNKRSGSIENITISTEATTITTPPYPFMNQADLATTIKYLLVSFNAKFEYFNERFYKKHEELVNITTITLHLSEENKVPKE